MAVAVLLERIAYRPLRNAPRLVPLDHRHRRLAVPPIHGPASSVGLQGYPSVAVLERTFTILGIPIGKTLLLAIVTRW